MITLSNLGKTYADRTLFDSVSLQLNAGERYGLVGANGSGKTTLLNILTGDLEASEGSLSIPQRLRLGVLRQDQFLYEGQKIINVALMGNNDLWNVMAEREDLLANAENEFDAERFSVPKTSISVKTDTPPRHTPRPFSRALACPVPYITIRSPRFRGLSYACSWLRCWLLRPTCCY